MRVSLDTLTSSGGDAVQTWVSSELPLPSKPQAPPDTQRAGVADGVPVPVCELEGVPVPVSELDGVPVRVCVLDGVRVPVCELEGVRVPVCELVGVRVPVCELEGVPVALDDDVAVAVGVLLTRWHTRTLSTSSCELPLASPTFLTRNTSSYEPVAEAGTTANDGVHLPSV